MTDREKRFCEEYMIDLDAKNAAIRAGYRVGAAKHASEWIREEKPEKPKLRIEIDRLRAEQARRTGVTADRVIRELARVAFADVTAAVDGQGRMRDDLDRETRAAISTIRISESQGEESSGRSVEIRAHDKNRALELLGKHLGMFAENVKIDLERMPRLIRGENGEVLIGDDEQ